jgi:hypothetical protein
MKNESLEEMVARIKAKDEWEKNRPIREGARIVFWIVVNILFFGWLAISIWLAVAGVQDNSCTSVSGDAYYCGE